MPDLVRHAAKRHVPVFGVCLGLQGIVEAFGGELGVLDYPMHGKPSMIVHRGQGVFDGFQTDSRSAGIIRCTQAVKNCPHAWK